MISITPIDYYRVARMDSLITIQDKDKFLELADSIIEDLIKEGFTNQEIVTYLWFTMSIKLT